MQSHGQQDQKSTDGVSLEKYLTEAVQSGNGIARGLKTGHVRQKWLRYLAQRETASLGSPYGGIATAICGGNSQCSVSIRSELVLPGWPRGTPAVTMTVSPVPAMPCARASSSALVQTCSISYIQIGRAHV